MMRRARDATFSAGRFIALAVVAAASGYHGAQHLSSTSSAPCDGVVSSVTNAEFLFFLTSLSFCITFNTATLHMCKSSQTISATEVLEPSSSLSISSFGIGVTLAKGALASRIYMYRSISSSKAPAQHLLVYYVRADAAGDDTTKDMQRNCSDCK